MRFWELVGHFDRLFLNSLEGFRIKPVGGFKVHHSGTQLHAAPHCPVIVGNRLIALLRIVELHTRELILQSLQNELKALLSFVSESILRTVLQSPKVFSIKRSSLLPTRWDAVTKKSFLPSQRSSRICWM